MPNQILGQPGQGNAGEVDDFEFASGPFVAQRHQGDLHGHRMAQRGRARDDADADASFDQQADRFEA